MQITVNEIKFIIYTSPGPLKKTLIPNSFIGNSYINLFREFLIFQAKIAFLPESNGSTKNWDQS